MPAVLIEVNGEMVEHFEAQLIVLGTPRPEGRSIDLTDPLGAPVTVRDPATLAPFVPVTLTGEAAGLSQVFLTPIPEGLASCDGGPVSRWSTPQYAEMLLAAQAAQTAAAAAAEGVAVSAEAAADSAASATSAAESAASAAAGLASATAGFVRAASPGAPALATFWAPQSQPVPTDLPNPHFILVVQGL